jgi:hypothetical protein
MTDFIKKMSPMMEDGLYIMIVGRENRRKRLENKGFLIKRGSRNVKISVWKNKKRLVLSLEIG